ncbi:low affinity iron permease family protein [Prosthecomicrobium sp. N25]|uniref:low affinity iron permease family protein n=1 Tax=Prosthecomicrobium sp. N25 TaxID=3129254 RepID=UPI0030774E08
MSISLAFTQFANAVARAAGRPITFALCCLLVIGWAVTGPMFHFSDTWQLVINTGTTIITFLMVFLIQNSQNRDGSAIQTKLDELIRVTEARNYFIGIEHLTEEALEEIRRRCEREAGQARPGDKRFGGVEATERSLDRLTDTTLAG